MPRRTFALQHMIQCRIRIQTSYVSLSEQPRTYRREKLKARGGRLQKGGEDTRARDAGMETHNHDPHFTNRTPDSTRTVRKQRNIISLGGKKGEAIEIEIWSAARQVLPPRPPVCSSSTSSSTDHRRPRHIRLVQ
jgi:hypothetical protein